MLHQMASDINKSKRMLYMILPLMTGSTQIIWQATSCRKPCKDGFLRLTQGKIIKLPVNHATGRRGHGSLKAKLSQNGNPPDQVLFCVSMANVSCRHPPTRSQRLKNITFRSWRREECILVRQSLLYLVLSIYGVD